MEIKSVNSKLKQSDIARKLKISSSTLQRYRREIKMLSPHKKPPSSNTCTGKQKTSNCTEHEIKLTSNYANWPQMTSKRHQMKMINLFLKK